MPRLRPAFRLALVGLALAVLVTFLVAGRWAPTLLVGGAPYFVPAVFTGLVFAAGVGSALERSRFAGRAWAGALLGLSTLTIAALAGGLVAWIDDGLVNPTRYLVLPLWVALMFGGAPALVLGVVCARGQKPFRG